MNQDSTNTPPRVLPFIPGTAPFTPEQRAWLNGYFVGLLSSADVPMVQPGQPVTSAPPKPMLVLYGSQTGSAEGLAKRIGKEASGRGFAPRVAELNSVTPEGLSQEQNLLIVTSTWGDGDPPDNASAFWAKLKESSAPKLLQLKYAVLALGDKNYSDFCGAGRKFDNRLEELGAVRLHPRTDCDVDFEASAQQWIQAVWKALEQVSGTSVEAAKPIVTSAPVVSETSTESYSRKNPFPARLLANRKLNRDGSAKDTRHFEISLEGSGLTYAAGDALGVVPHNCRALVDEVLRALRAKGTESVKNPSGNEISFEQALSSCYEIRQPTPALLNGIAQFPGTEKLKDLLLPERKAELDQYLYGREMIDLFLEYPQAVFEPKEFVGLLRKLQPRLYSISSSPKAHPGQVHLTVAAVRYEAHGRARKGVCSTFLADRVNDTVSVPVFVQTSHGFRLPSDVTKPVIMVGPGTGIAPFRAFLEERRVTGASGKNWLFFGDQQKSSDFLYEEELIGMLTAGSLHRMDTAFSRDQRDKIYVQNRMMESANDLWQWLEEGAHFYVCGDAKRMAKDVDKALHQIVQTGGGKTEEQAVEYVQCMKQSKRYQRDVY